MNEKTLLKIAEPSFITDICEHVISGGGLPNLCELLQIRYSHVVHWIYEDPDRAEKYSQALAARAEWVIQSVLNELKDIALADIRLAYTSDGVLLPVNEWPAALARVVQAVEVTEEFDGQGSNRRKVGETKRLKLWDKLKAIELLGKNLKLFKEQVEHTGTLTLEELVAGSLDPNMPKPIPIIAIREEVPVEPETVKEITEDRS